MASVAPVREAFPSSSPCTSIPPPGSYKYHVFLSFRGEDTRKKFTDHLCKALKRKGIIAFRDNKDLERGTNIRVELLKAIEASMIGVIILSPNYASSTWCLDELQHIVACSSKRGLSIMPIFYDVEPSDVRHQKGSFEEAFMQHGKKFRRDSEKVRRWREALTEVARIAGWDSRDKHEAELVECIAEDIHKKIQKSPELVECIAEDTHEKTQKSPPFTNNLVGIASTMKETAELIGKIVRIKGKCGVSSKGRKVSGPEVEVEVELKPKNKIEAIFGGGWIK